jgi:predicted nucleotidyltransferase
MSLNKEEKLALNKVISKVKEHFRVKKMILFGSKARNDARDDSDIDILLLVDDRVDDHARWKLSDILTEIEWETEIYISCKLFNYSDWEKENEDVVFLPFKDNVTREGELLEI